MNICLACEEPYDENRSSSDEPYDFCSASCENEWYDIPFTDLVRGEDEDEDEDEDSW